MQAALRITVDAYLQVEREAWEDYLISPPLRFAHPHAFRYTAYRTGLQNEQSSWRTWINFRATCVTIKPAAKPKRAGANSSFSAWHCWGCSLPFSSQ